MDNNKRSSQYDWFKGNTTPGGKPKNSGLKFAWKITRIFIYLALFVFTMTGCVQIFVIKTNNTVGDGVEFYSSEKDISPHVTKFIISKDNSQPTKEIYSLGLDNKKPVWVDDGPTLDLIKNELKTQGLGKLSDSFKGRNEAISIQGDVYQEKGWDDKHSIEMFDGNRPATWSSHSGDKGGPLVIRSATKDISKLGVKYFATQFYHQSIKVDFGFFDANNDAGLSKEAKESLFAINTIIGKKLKKNKTIFEWLDDNLSKNPILKTQKTPISAETASAQNMILGIMHYAGVEILPPQIAADDGSTLAQVSYTNDFMPGLGTGSSQYRPMVTWGDAWKRGPFYGIFVYPIGQIASHMIGGMGDMNGWEMILTIFLVVWLIRLLTFLLSFKSMLQQQKMQEVQGKKAVIDAKYAAYKGNKQMEMRKNQEVQELYKKEGISMFGSIGSIFLTMPFFLAIWRVIGAVPHIKSAEWLGISFPATSYKELFGGHFQYLPLLILAAFFAAAQQIVPRLLTKKRNNTRINVQQKAAMKKNNRTQNIMIIVFVVMAVIFNAGLQIYWIAGGIWMIGQSYVTHRIIVWQSKRKRKLKVKA